MISFAENFDATNRRSRRLVDTARTSFAKSCDDILDRYGLAVPPKRQGSGSGDSSSITTISSLPELPEYAPLGEEETGKHDPVTTTTTTRSVPYTSIANTAVNNVGTTLPVATIPNTEHIETVTNGNLHENEADTERTTVPAGGARSKLMQMSSMKLHEFSTETADSADVSNDGCGSENKGKNQKGERSCLMYRWSP